MNFEEIIKEEWEKEFPLGIDDQPPLFGNSIFTMYEPMVERICIRVWNSALDLAADKAEINYKDKSLETFVDIESILKLKINEQGTDTTEV